MENRSVAGAGDREGEREFLCGNGSAYPDHGSGYTDLYI